MKTLLHNSPGTGVLAKHFLRSSARRVVTSPIFKPHFPLDSAAEGWGDFYAAGTLSFDSTDKKGGAASMKIITPTNAGNAGYNNNIPDGDWSAKAFRIWIKVNSWTNLNELSILVSTSGVYDAFFICNLVGKVIIPLANEWIEVTLTRDDFTVGAGAPDWTTVNQLAFRAASANTFTNTVWFDEFSVFPEGGAGYVSVVFDDAWESSYSQGKLKMDAYGMKGTIYTIPEAIDTANYLTTAQLTELHRQGWDIASHGNVNLTGLSAAALEAELVRIKRWFFDRGFIGQDNFAYVEGSYNQAVADATMKYFSIARTIEAWSNPTSYLTPRNLAARAVVTATSTGTIQGWIDNAVTYKKWLIIVFHKIVASPAVDTEYSIANFGTIIDYLNTNNVNVLPVSEVLRRL